VNPNGRLALRDSPAPGSADQSVSPFAVRKDFRPFFLRMACPRGDRQLICVVINGKYLHSLIRLG
jgi:hypothetical protein